MSGGSFDYNQYKIGYIADEIERLIKKNGCKKTKDEIRDNGYRSDFYEDYPEELYHHKYPKEIIKEFRKGLKILRKAQIYAHEIDWLISGDNGDESFLRSLKEELEKL